MKPSRAKIALVVAAVGVVLVAVVVAAAAAVTVVIVAAAAVAAATAAIASQDGKHFSLSPRVSSVVILNKGITTEAPRAKSFRNNATIEGTTVAQLRSL